MEWGWRLERQGDKRRIGLWELNSPQGVFLSAGRSGPLHCWFLPSCSSVFLVSLVFVLFLPLGSRPPSGRGQPSPASRTQLAFSLQFQIQNRLEVVGGALRFLLPNSLIGRKPWPMRDHYTWVFGYLREEPLWLPDPDVGQTNRQPSNKGGMWSVHWREQGTVGACTVLCLYSRSLPGASQELAGLGSIESQ